MFFFHEKKVCEDCRQEFYAHIDDAYKWKYCPKCSTPQARNRRGYLRRRSHLTTHAPDDAMRTPKTELTITNDRIYSNSATGATPRRR